MNIYLLYALDPLYTHKAAPIFTPWTDSLVKIEDEPLPDAFTVLHDDEGHGHEQHGHEAEHRGPPAVTERTVEVRRKQGKHGADNGAKDRPGGDGRGGVPRKGVDVVVLYGVEDENHAESEEGGAEDGHEPEIATFHRPAVHEEAEGHADRADVGDGDAVLWFAHPSVAPVGESVVESVDLGDPHEHGGDEAHAETNVRESRLPRREAVPPGPDLGKRGEEEVEAAVEEGHVARHDEDDGLQEENLHGSLDGLPQPSLQTPRVVVGGDGRVPQLDRHPPRPQGE